MPDTIDLADKHARTRHLLGKRRLTTLRALSPSEVDIIVKMCAAGVRPADIPAVLAYEPADPDAVPAPTPTKVGTVVVQAYSFVRDPGQYAATYGLTSARAAELRDLLASDSEKAQEEIRAIVAKRLRDRGSPKVAHVVLGAAPSNPEAKAFGRVADAEALALFAKAGGYQAQVGAYDFDVEETGRKGRVAFRVRLGAGLAAVGHNRRVALCAARLVRVLGRHDPVLAPYIAQFAGGEATFGEDVEADIPDGRGPPKWRPADPEGAYDDEAGTGAGEGDKGVAGAMAALSVKDSRGSPASPPKGT